MVPDADPSGLPLNAGGVLPALLTPFDAGGQPDVPALVAHGRALLDQGAAGLLLFGTTGEGFSLTTRERMETLEAVLAAGLPAERLMVTVTETALPAAVAAAAHASARQVAGVLVAPPFFLKKVSEAGLAAWYGRLIESVGHGTLRLYLYNYPSMTGLTLGQPLVERLYDAYPGSLLGVKDSGPDGDTLLLLHRAFPDLRVYAGRDRFLRKLRRAGGAGSITALNNLALPLALTVWNDPAGEAGLAADRTLDRLAAAFKDVPLIPALKAVLARQTGQPGWARVRPPLEPLPPAAAEAVARAVAAVVS